MKGIFFTELLEMTEKEYGIDITEKIIAELGVGNNGVYEATYDYPYTQFVEMCDILSNEVKNSVSDLVKNFGEYLFSRLVILFRPDFAGNTDVFEFLGQIDDFIHHSIQERFTKVEIPRFKAIQINDSTFQISCQSEEVLIDLAIGLFMGCQRFFNEELTLKTEFISKRSKLVCFTLSKNHILV
ncbi:heme NO-binding domain-containing protein [Labilibaculum sp.]|uniref:heme NO-binding domain-containing protein n=1 Tax=Labilibaculum sp. TaxID=2060723 RepID=UPI0035616619